MCTTGVIIGFTVRINLFKYKRFKDGRHRYKILGRATLKSMLRLPALNCNSVFEILETEFAVGANAKKWISSFLSRRTQ